MQKIKDWSEIIRMILSVFILASYALILPFSIFIALYSPITLVGYATSNFTFWIAYISLFSIPVLIVITFIASFMTKGKSLRWLLLPFIGIFVFLLVSGIDHYYRERKQLQNQPIPFSQRGLPLSATDVPVTLPPDPGEAGKQTLAGIDSNNDGVRDDLEREIVYMYPQNEEVRRVLRAMVKKGQDVITTTGDHDHFEKLMISYFSFKHCYILLVFGLVNVNTDYTNSNILWDMIRNTPERKKVFEANDTKGKPYVVSVDPSCDAVKGQY